MAALKAWPAVVALSWATAGFAASAGTQQPVIPHGVPGTTAAKQPSIELLPQQPTLAGTCGGSAFDVNTFINVTGVASAAVTVAAPGVGTIEEFIDETGTNIGPYNAVYPTFHILPFGGGLPPNTKITITITTYSGPNRTGSVSFVSKLVFNCTTGNVIHAGPVANVAESIPALSTVGLAAMTTLLALLGAAMIRRPAKRRTVRR
ncbi:MAG: IPTL-CTERM sorting domain-containing protein [Pseudomonadota bacterium]|nr:IPTL-CTERM sorting domain-containing protein [Pseudomonadota bacterium]